eukprot:CAMPEP_0198235390 /NCGR_PEP_ID=MMETSP1446-20131203/1287_1 /TAXON_ID=1461542 ORGANISM="Unidentified sp, Strain CCMP2111" /NCGR_SAMPLE_ID=MMETSP1446 /ASSEMBLY_ACC=CAM_ASM_001112 /LENGTH=140 /DNA_ID=CAMNT_0043916531 /DNA_START=349 /DNA_END=767 /DNA_ORIENTATION=-
MASWFFTPPSPLIPVNLCVNPLRACHASIAFSPRLHSIPLNATAAPNQAPGGNTAAPSPCHSEHRSATLRMPRHQQRDQEACVPVLDQNPQEDNSGVLSSDDAGSHPVRGPVGREVRRGADARAPRLPWTGSAPQAALPV